MKIYLAGGMRGNWREQIKNEIEGVTFFDPTTKDDEILTLKEIFTWDLEKVKESDIIFAYIERTNPSGVGTSFELGSTFAQDKTIILVLEKNNQHTKDRYLSFLEPAADITYYTLQNGINFLKILTKEQT